MVNIKIMLHGNEIIIIKTNRIICGQWPSHKLTILLLINDFNQSWIFGN